MRPNVTIARLGKRRDRAHLKEARPHTRGKPEAP